MIADWRTKQVNNDGAALRGQERPAGFICGFRNKAMQSKLPDKLHPRNVRSGYDVYAKPVVMSQPEETRVKQRQRLISDEVAKHPQPDSRPPTPPGKLQIERISSMLQQSPTGSTAVMGPERSSDGTPKKPFKEGPAGQHHTKAEGSSGPLSASIRQGGASEKPAPAHRTNGHARLVAEV